MDVATCRYINRLSRLERFAEAAAGRAWRSGNVRMLARSAAVRMAAHERWLPIIAAHVGRYRDG